MRDVQPNVVFQNLRHQAVHAATNGCEQHQDIGTLVTFSYRTLDRVNLSSEPLDAGKQFLFFLGDFREFVLHFFLVFYIFLLTDTVGGYYIGVEPGKPNLPLDIGKGRMKSSRGNEPPRTFGGFPV